MKFFYNKIKIICCVSFLLFFPINAYAYLDPGSVNIFLQIAAGLLSAFFLFISSHLNYINTFI